MTGFIVAVNMKRLVKFVSDASEKSAKILISQKKKKKKKTHTYTFLYTLVFLKATKIDAQTRRCNLLR